MNILRKIREVDKALNEGLITYQEAADAVAPFTDAEPIRHGHWVKSSEYKGDDISGYTDNTWVCSECSEEAIVNEWYMYDLTDYCPHCGAKMEYEGAENE